MTPCELIPIKIFSSHGQKRLDLIHLAKEGKAIQYN